MCCDVVGLLPLFVLFPVSYTDGSLLIKLKNSVALMGVMAKAQWCPIYLFLLHESEQMINDKAQAVQSAIKRD